MQSAGGRRRKERDGREERWGGREPENKRRDFQEDKQRERRRMRREGN